MMMSKHGIGSSHRIALVFASILSLLRAERAEPPPALMGLDLGNEFMKITLTKDRKFDIALNIESSRKTAASVSFAGKTREFNNAALGHQNRHLVGAFSYINRLMGRSYTECSTHDTDLKKCVESELGLHGDYYASYELIKDEARGVWELITDGGKRESMPLELIIANVMQYAKGIAEASNDGHTIKDAVVTVPSSYNQRQRQAVLDAAKIAGMNALLIHETSSSAVNLAMDWVAKGENPENILFYNMGARSTEVCIAEFTGRETGMVKGRTSPSIVMKGCVHDERFGGHHADIALADEMKRRFVKKYPQHKSIEKAPRALRKLLVSAKKTRHQLSAGKESMFSVENLYEEIDFQSKITRSEFEELLEGEAMWDLLTNPIDKCLEKASMTLKDIDALEIVGSAWRMPRVQKVLNEYLNKAQSDREAKEALYLGQHLNGDETFVLGASLYAANATRAIRPPKKVFFSDSSSHNYTMDIIDLETGAQIKNTTDIASQGSKMGLKKKITVGDSTKDFAIKMYENGQLLTTWKVTGLEEAISGKFADLMKAENASLPKAAFTIGPDTSGIVGISKKVEALFVETIMEEVVDEEAMRARRAKKLAEKGAQEDNTTNGTNSTEGENVAANNSTKEQSDTNATDEEETKQFEDANKESADDAKKTEKDAPTEDEADTKKDDQKTETSDKKSVNKEKEDSNKEGDEPPIMKKKEKKKNHVIQLKVERIDEFPLPLNPEQLSAAMDKLHNMTKHDSEAAELEEVKNDLESFFYTAREKLGYADAYKAVTTEEQRQQIQTKVDETELWTEDINKDTTLSEIKEKYKALEDLWEPVKKRAVEYDSRADFVISMDKEMSKMQDIRKKVETEMTWLKKEDIEKATKKVEEFMADWEAKKEKQAATPGHDEPVFTKVQVENQAEKSFEDLRRLSKVKKPKERKKKDKKEKKKDTRTLAQLQEALAKNEKELQDVKQKKVDAVTAEDFDLAEKLKTTEKKLGTEQQVLKESIAAAQTETPMKEGEEKSESEAKPASEEKESQEQGQNDKKPPEEDKKPDGEEAQTGEEKKNEKEGDEL